MDRFDPEDRVFNTDGPSQEQAYEGAFSIPDIYPMDEVVPAHVSPHPSPPTGSELRRRLITPEVLAQLAQEPPKRSLLQRLLGRH